MLNSSTEVKVGTLTLNSSQSAATKQILIRQSGHVVTIWGYINNLSLTVNTATDIGVISGVSLPADVVRISGRVASQPYQVGGDCYVALGTSGGLAVTPAAAGSSIYFNIAYIR